MSVRVRFAPSPTGSLHVGDALSAVANRTFADEPAERCCSGSTTPTRRATCPAGKRRSSPTSSGSACAGTRGRCGRASGTERYREAAAELAPALRPRDAPARGRHATYQLASVVDDGDFGITHVIRGNDHRPNEELHRRLHEALGTRPPEYVHHGLILGEDGKKLSKRPALDVATCATPAFPPRPSARYLEELGLPRARRPPRPRPDPPPRARGDRGDERRRAGRASWASRSVRVPRRAGARDLREAREYARHDPRAAARRSPTCRPRRSCASPSSPSGSSTRRATVAGAEGGRRRSPRASARAHRPRPRPGARGRARGAAAGGGAAPRRGVARRNQRYSSGVRVG